MWLKKNVILLSGAPCLRDLSKDKGCHRDSQARP